MIDVNKSFMIKAVVKSEVNEVLLFLVLLMVNVEKTMAHHDVVTDDGREEGKVVCTSTLHQTP